MAEEQQLRLDLDELRHLESIAKRPRVLSLLSSEIRDLDAKLSRVTDVTAAARQAAIAAEKVPVNVDAVNRSYVTLGSFSWDQDNDKIKIYISIEDAEQEKVDTVFKPMSVDIKFHDIHGKNYRFAIPKLNKEILPEKCKLVVKPNKVIVTLVKGSKGNWLDLHLKEDKIYISIEDAEQEKVDTVFKPMSVDIKFHDIHGKNYRFAIPKLNKEILPEKCKLVVKPNKVIVTLVKGSKGNWLDLHLKEDKLKPNLDKDKDPMAGIMDLMKNMYEEGDDEMKRTIAKAWSDARSGKTADPLKSYP
ncbi:hypothetical protein C4D60_Mb06t27640 [Musa balbisiana]|uniref:Calcyclin-binding protein n=1 Tax=Musa balbisiana TaxID=52838 RepID=A0A4V4H484_MUSBA|nr:hypothetical protein C4D60_Mb06t27640 [Musa balbisiana]